MNSSLALVLILGSFVLWGNLTVSAATYHGNCGETLTWTLNTDTGVLTISGMGDMAKNYNSSWDNYRESIKSVVFPNDITSIGNEMFSGCTSLAGVVIPDSVTSIGSYKYIVSKKYHCYMDYILRKYNPYILF